MKWSVAVTVRQELNHRSSSQLYRSFKCTSKLEDTILNRSLKQRTGIRQLFVRKIFEKKFCQFFSKILIGSYSFVR